MLFFAAMLFSVAKDVYFCVQAKLHNMEQLNLPSYAINVREHGGRRQIYDELRRRYVALTPEEWVRQHFVHYLTGHLGYPLSLMGNEVRISVGAKLLRADTMVYNRQLQPEVVVEYKAPAIALTRKVFDQVAAYNQQLRVRCMMLSNGVQHMCFLLDTDSMAYRQLKDIPTYEQLKRLIDNG